MTSGLGPFFLRGGSRWLMGPRPIGATRGDLAAAGLPCRRPEGVCDHLMELTFLGSGNAFAQGGRYWSSFLADNRYLFDAPPTLLPHLKRLEIPLTGIEVVFISHFHGDHFMGLPFLFLEYVYLTQRRDDLFIVGPPGVEQKIEEFAAQCYQEVTRDAGYRRRYVDAQPGADQFVNEIGFQAFPMNHVLGKLECFGYRVHTAGKTVAYTGDTMLCDEIFQLADGT